MKNGYWVSVENIALLTLYITLLLLLLLRITITCESHRVLLRFVFAVTTMLITIITLYTELIAYKILTICPVGYCVTE